MIIILWLITIILFLAALTLLGWNLTRNPRSREWANVLLNGFRTALRDCGWKPPRRYPVELWIWETMDDEDVCEDCLERTSWPPMDIADWMKEGLPGTPEADTECGCECRCRLIRHDPRSARPKHRAQ